MGVSRVQQLSAVQRRRQGRGCRGLARRRAQGAAHGRQGSRRHPAAQIAQGHEGDGRIRPADPGPDREGRDGREGRRDRARPAAGRSAARRRGERRAHGCPRPHRDPGAAIWSGATGAERWRRRPRGRFITIEGGEGAGKSTQVGLLVGRARAGRDRRCARRASPAARRAPRRSGGCCSKATASAGMRSAKRCCWSPRGATMSPG